MSLKASAHKVLERNTPRNLCATTPKKERNIGPYTGVEIRPKLRSKSALQDLFDERAAIAEYDGGLSRQEAESRAFECCIVEWLDQNHTPSYPGSCAWCGSQESVEEIVVPFGTEPTGHIWLHHECWTPWMRQRRIKAQQALLTMGVKPPGPSQ